MWITQKRPFNKRGFTLIELLIAIAIIGILVTVVTVALLQARRRARDTKRVSDIQQVRNALVIYANTRATYPEAGVLGTERTLGEAGALCLDDSDAGFRDTCGGSGLTVLMERVPGEVRSLPHAPYTYEKTGANTYAIGFELEGAIGDLEGGLCEATQEEVTCAVE